MYVEEGGCKQYLLVSYSIQSYSDLATEVELLPRTAYARAGLSNWFCPSVVCLSSEKNCNLVIYRVKRLVYSTITLNSKKNLRLCT